MINNSISKIKQNFHFESEKALNDQININLYSTYVYLSISTYFDRYDVALPGFSRLFKDCSEVERKHADKLIHYFNQRGGHLLLQDIKRPENNEWGSCLQALNTGLILQKQVNASFLCLHAVSSSHNDPHLNDFIEDDFLPEKVKTIKMFSDLITKLNRCGNGLGEYLLDKELQT